MTAPFGLCPTRAEVYKNRALKWLHTALDFGGFFFDGFDFVNVLLYHFEGRDTEAAITLLCLILGMGNFFELPVRLMLKLGDNAGEALIKLGKKYLPDLMEKGSRFLDWAGGKVDDVWRWIEKKLGRAGVEGGSKTKDIYRAVSPEEYDDIFSINGFRARQDGRSFQAKEFGNNFEETLEFANQSINSDKAAIIKVTIPEEIYNQLNHMNLDSAIFKSGTPVVEPEMLDIFNKNIINIEHVF